MTKGAIVIGIDAREAEGPDRGQRIGAAGRGRYVHELLKRLPALAPDDRFVFYTGRSRGAATPPNVAWCEVSGSGPSWHWRVARRAGRECTVYFSTMTYVTPQLLDRPYVQTVYDLIPFKHFAFPQARSARVERLTLRRAVRRARQILTISRTTADDLLELVPDAAPKVTPTPLAADGRFRADRDPAELAAVRMRYGLPDRFVLAVGTIEPRKNFLRLVKAHSALPAALRTAYPLVLAGRKGWDWEPVLVAAAEQGPRAVRHIEFVPDEDLAILYSAASLFCYPSLYEGFGFPVLEAMQAGTPVVTSAVSSLPEVGGDAVRYVDPHDVTGLRDLIAELLADERELERLRDAGVRRAKQFSWEKTAAATLEALKSAAP
jgi:glycosyltransferase involved in cell wall biosynthesis